MQVKDFTIFSDVSDVFGIGNPAIAEKDYYVVQLLKVLSQFPCEHHEMIFAGGTSLAKANIKLQRMSEDVDIKLVVLPSADSETKSAMRQHRKKIRTELTQLLNDTGIFKVNLDDIKSRDDNRYIEIPVQYTQNFTQAPCLRPFIKLELIETELLAGHTPMTICSLHNEALQKIPEIQSFNTVELISTQAEKILSMLRRTASFSRNPDRADDNALVRHIYDTYHLQQNQSFGPEDLAQLIAKGMKMDVSRYGRQHPEFVENPILELRYGLNEIATNGLYKQRYEAFVKPMVFGTYLSWEDAFTVFSKVAIQALDYIERNTLI
jgi:predicted nucleotidyltransferase component of viral defense system